MRNALGQPDLRVLTGAKRADAESPENAVSREDIVAGLTVFAVLAAFIAVFVVASTFALSVQQRHRELALFRAIGSTPNQVRRMVAGEALFISLCGVRLRGSARRARSAPRAGSVHQGRHGSRRHTSSSSAGSRLRVGSSQRSSRPTGPRPSRARVAPPASVLREGWEASVHRRPVSWIRGMAGVGVLTAGVAVLVVFAREPRPEAAKATPPPRR